MCFPFLLLALQCFKMAHPTLFPLGTDHYFLSGISGNFRKSIQLLKKNRARGQPWEKKNSSKCFLPSRSCGLRVKKFLHKLLSTKKKSCTTKARGECEKNNSYPRQLQTPPRLHGKKKYGPSLTSVPELLGKSDRIWRSSLGIPEENGTNRANQEEWLLTFLSLFPNSQLRIG